MKLQTKIGPFARIRSEVIIKTAIWCVLIILSDFLFIVFSAEYTQQIQLTLVFLYIIEIFGEN